MRTFSTGVWDDQGHDSMNRRSFFFAIGAMLSWGFILMSIVAGMTANWNIGIWSFILLVLISFAGLFVAVGSNNMVQKLIGYHMIIIPLSVIIGPALNHVVTLRPGTVERALFMTALMSASMGVTGILFPSFYSRIGGVLFGALIALLCVSVLRLFIPSIQNVGIIDYISVVIFSLYIGYDMHRATVVSATLDNAVDIAISLWLDIVNVFFSLLNIFGIGDD